MPMFIEIESTDNTPKIILHIPKSPKAHIKFIRVHYTTEHSHSSQTNPSKHHIRKTMYWAIRTDLLQNRISTPRFR